MFQHIFNFLRWFVKDKPLSFLFNAKSVKAQPLFTSHFTKEIKPKPLCDTYVLATTINNPASLFIDEGLADPADGFYICSTEEIFNSAIAYIDVSNLNLEQTMDAAEEFLESLQAEVRKTGGLAKRGDWNAF